MLGMLTGQKVMLVYREEERKNYTAHTVESEWLNVLFSPRWAAAASRGKFAMETQEVSESWVARGAFLSRHTGSSSLPTKSPRGVQHSLCSGQDPETEGYFWQPAARDDSALGILDRAVS